MKITIRLKGGPGSGHRGHRGRPGKRGGSVPGGRMTVDRAVDVVEELALRYGMPVVEVVESDRKWVAAHVGPGRVVHINPAITDDPRNFESDALPKNQRELIIHEYGHIVHDELSYISKYAKYGLGNAALRAEAGISWEESLASKLDSISHRVGHRLSEYATKNAEEYFAEAFVAYNRGTAWHSKIHPEVLTILEDLDVMVSRHKQLPIDEDSKANLTEVRIRIKGGGDDYE